MKVRITTLFVSLALISACFVAFSFPYGMAQAQETDSVPEPTANDELTAKSAERQALELQLSELEKEIEAHQQTIEQYRKEGKTLTNEIGSLNAKIDKLNLQIKSINLTLAKLNQDITNTQRSINQTENKIGGHKEVLAKSVQSLYESDRTNLAQVVLAYQNLSEFFGYLNNITLVQESVRNALTTIIKLRQTLLEEKQELSLKKEDAENFRVLQESQKKGVQTTQAQKNELLKVTKGKETEFQKILTKTKESAAQIRTRIFELLGGGELTFEKAYEYARLAEGATGVRAALILSILHRESLLGKNVGRCSYATAMHPTRDKPYFLDLLSRLNIDPNSDFAKVSCANQHGSYGGAMGPAQFIPSTWKLYEGEVTKVTGNNPPSPWNNADAFAATAIYMKDLLDSASCKSYANENKNIVAYQTLIERCAAAKYYSGSRWYTYRFWYGDPVVTQANAFEDDIAVLKANGSASLNSAEIARYER